MARQLVTCPVCKTDQHLYRNRICNHDGLGAIRCTGSRTSLKVLTEKDADTQLRHKHADTKLCHSCEKYPQRYATGLCLRCHVIGSHADESTATAASIKELTNIFVYRR
jgi:hypothetical protein